MIVFGTGPEPEAPVGAPVEDHLGQIWQNGKWVDYARSTSGPASFWQAVEPSTRRVVHYISGEVLIPSVCPKVPLDASNPDGPKAFAHVGYDEEYLPLGGLVMLCHACGFRMVD